ncbi:glycoside hydrolase family 25 protein [Pelomyxa schiedti]|nr:glycoside hydrolase family 25 protein [Pelomyxa schiedti]
MVALTLVFVFSAFCLQLSLATSGFDHSYYQGAVNTSSYECLFSGGYRYAIMQAQTGHPPGTGHYNPYIGENYHNAVSAGIYPVDVYIFPDYGLDPAGQVNSTITSLFEDDVLYHDNMIWMDVEGTEYWIGTCDENIQFLHTVISTAEAMYSDCGLKYCIGIYSSASQWSPIMCDTTEFSSYPIWYAHYDNNPSFSDWKNFGGWTSPVMKQITGTTDLCGTQIDNDYRP